MKMMNCVSVTRHAASPPAYRLAARTLALMLGLAVAGVARAAPALPELPVGDFANPAEAAAWATVTDKWAKGDSTLTLNLAKAGAEPVLSVRAKLGKKFGFPFAGARRYFQPGGVPIDMSSYKGVRLRVRGNTQFKLQVQSGAVADFNEFAAQVPVDKQWRVVDLPFRDFAQNAFWGKQVKWNPAQLRGVVVFFEGLPGAPEAAVEISKISLYK
jgi:hypothetical protein